MVFGCIFFRLCVILFTKQGQHEKEKLVLKLLAKDKKYLSEKRVQFLYVYVDVQRELIAEFKDGRKDDKCVDNSTASKVNTLLVNFIFEQILFTYLEPTCYEIFSHTLSAISLPHKTTALY